MIVPNRIAATELQSSATELPRFGAAAAEPAAEAPWRVAAAAPWRVATWAWAPSLCQCAPHPNQWGHHQAGCHQETRGSDRLIRLRHLVEILVPLREDLHHYHPLRRSLREVCG